MSYSDWDPDDLLNFDYGKPIPDDQPNPQNDNMFMKDLPKRVCNIEEAPQKARSVEEDIKLYERLRQESADEIIRQAKLEAQEEVYQKYTKKKPPKSNNKQRKDKSARRQSNATSNKDSKLYKFSKYLSLIYVVALAAFVILMTTMNILPFFMLILLYVVLGLLSFIIVIQLTKNNIKRWAKVVSTIMAIVLIVVYGTGCAYALGTLSFLDKTSKNAVDNENRVEKITKEPFNVLITGMDVWGTIDEQGRSDVNMVVTVNPETETILLTSIPRDYEVSVPEFGYETDKLTHTGFYSTETTIGAVEELLGITTNYYVKVNFDTIVKFIDAIGGLDFNNEIEFTSAITNHYYAKGMIHVQGRGALYYARERKAFIDGDNQRVKNQQVIFSEMLKKAMSSRTMVLSYNKVLNELDEYFEMSFSSKEIRSLVKNQLARNPKWKIFKNSIVGGNGSMATHTTGSQKCYVMTQDPYSIANATELIQAVKDGKEIKKDKETGEVYVVEETTEETQDAA